MNKIWNLERKTKIKKNSIHKVKEEKEKKS